MSHEVTDLEPVYEFLNKIDSENSKLWEARYICFIWLSLICMIPFYLKKIDSDQSHQSLIVNMLDLCKKYLCSTGKERDGASLLIARLLSRQDLCDEHMVPFIEWTKQRLSSDADVFEVIFLGGIVCLFSHFDIFSIDNWYPSKFVYYISISSSQSIITNIR